MLNNISWQSYWTTIVLLSALYYISVYLLYFRKDLVLSRSKPKEGIASGAMPSSPPREEELYDHALDELAAFFEEAKKRRWEKSELLYSIQRFLKKYYALKNTFQAEALIKTIRLQAEEICPVHFSDEEIVHVWLDQ